MRFKFIQDIAGDKIDVVNDAMSFYSSLKAKDKSITVIDELIGNMYLLQQPDNIFDVEYKDDTEVFNTLDFAEWLEVSITNCIMKIDSLELDDDIIKNDKYNGEGILYKNNGKMLEGIWKDNKFQYTKKIKDAIDESNFFINNYLFM